MRYVEKMHEARVELCERRAGEVGLGLLGEVEGEVVVHDGVAGGGVERGRGFHWRVLRLEVSNGPAATEGGDGERWAKGGG